MNPITNKLKRRVIRRQLVNVLWLTVTLVRRYRPDAASREI